MAKASATTWYEKHPELLSFGLISFAISQLLSIVSFEDGVISSNWLGLIGHACSWFWLKTLGLTAYPFFVALCFFSVAIFISTEKIGRYLASFLLGTVSLSLLFTIIASLYPALEFSFSRWSGFASSDPQPALRLGGVLTHYIFCKIPHVNMQYLLNTAGCSLLALIGLTTSTLLLFEYKIQNTIDWLQEKRKNRAKEPKKKEVTMVFAQIDEKKPEPKTLIGSLREKYKDKLNKKKELAESLTPATPPVAPKSIPEEKAAPSATPYGELPPSFSNIPDSLKSGAKKEPAPIEKPKPERKIEENRKTDAAYHIPDIDHLNALPKCDLSNLKKELKQKADLLEETLLSFGIEAKVGQIHSGPTITSFEVHPAVGVKVGRIKTLEHDIALNLEAKSIRIIAPIPGKAAVGIEVPNKQPQEVSFREILAAYQSQQHAFKIPLLLGKSVNGDLVMTDLTRMPHCIIAGATGAGKSVCINSIVMSILMTSSPDEIKLLMIDPKKVELTPYTDLPHMLAPVITEPQSACLALNWLVKEMERRYEILKLTGQRNIDAFNKRKIDQEFEKSLDLNIPEKLPYYVAIIDELADLMMVASSDIETPIARIAQMARAVGIHLILATQRPSREVITGLIKANFPSRIAFKVASRVNSQIILDDIGAETLLGNGDMLVQLPGSSQLLRAQGAFVRDDEIQRVIDYIGRQAPPQYTIASFERLQYEMMLQDVEKQEGPQDALFDEARAIVFSTGNASTTFLQRKLKIGYARAASLMDELESAGVVGPQEGAKPRKIFFPSSLAHGELAAESADALLLDE